MEVWEVFWDRELGSVTAEGYPYGNEFTITNDCNTIEIEAGDNIRVVVDGDKMRVRALGNEPLIVHEGEDGKIEIKTTSKPSVNISKGK